MDFTLSPEIEALRVRVRALVDELILPAEDDLDRWGEGEMIAEPALANLRDQVKQAGLWCPQMPKERGGLGLDTVGMAVLYEEMGRARFGPVSFNCAAPDDGNMLVLAKVADADQQDRWLQPVIDGTVRSSIAMTEPPPGSGSDPAGMMQTRAIKKSDRYVVSGKKWFITGADGARHIILLARTSDDPRRGLTAMMVDASQPGWRILRRIPIMGPEEHGGHCEVEIEGLEVPFDNILLGEGLGMKVTQIRLGVARLTHCMRWLGMARRALEIALPYIGERRAFGTVLKDRESVQQMVGEVAMRIDTGRLLTMRAATKLARGERARTEVSMAKIQVADTLHAAVDTAIQLLGARGYSKDLPLEWMYRYARQARLVDGASEVHKMVVARGLIDGPDAFFSWR